jgi:hypothetical protein
MEARTAPIPSLLWEKHNSERTQKNLAKTGSDAPACTVCGAALNPEKAVTVGIIDGGSAFIHPDDIDETVESDGGYMGVWDLGSACVRLAPARVRKPYTEARKPVLSQDDVTYGGQPEPNYATGESFGATKSSTKPIASVLVDEYGAAVEAAKQELVAAGRKVTVSGLCRVLRSYGLKASGTSLAKYL